MLKIQRKLMMGMALAALAPLFLPLGASAADVKAVRGVITSIEGDNVTLKQPWGEDIVVVFDRKRREKPFRDPLEVGDEVAVILDADASVPTAERLCVRIVPAPPYVAVTPIQIPTTPAPVSRPVPPPPVAPAPMAPPPQILYY